MRVFSQDFNDGEKMPEKHVFNGMGYQGRTGVYEMLEMTNELVEAINHDDTGVFVQAARKQMAGQTLRRDAVRLVVNGKTSIDEAMRISNQFED